MFVLSAPPRESAEAGERLYGPVARLLGEALGRNVEYHHSGTWGVYRTQMLAGTYDIVFDGPHLNGYRAARLGHTVLVKVDEPSEMVLIARQDFPFVSVQRMAGRTFCTHAPPNLGALVLLALFDNPSRQPALIATDSWGAIYRGVTSGSCAAGVMPLAQFEKLNIAGVARVLYRTPPMPNQAFSAGPRLNASERTRLTQALLSDAGQAALQPLRDAYRIRRLAPADNNEYLHLADLLRGEWGYF